MYVDRASIMLIVEPFDSEAADVDLLVRKLQAAARQWLAISGGGDVRWRVMTHSVDCVAEEPLDFA